MSLLLVSVVIICFHRSNNVRHTFVQNVIKKCTLENMDLFVKFEYIGSQRKTCGNESISHFNVQLPTFKKSALSVFVIIKGFSFGDFNFEINVLSVTYL